MSLWHDNIGMASVRFCVCGKGVVEHWGLLEELHMCCVDALGRLLLW